MKNIKTSILILVFLSISSLPALSMKEEEVARESTSSGVRPSLKLMRKSSPKFETDNKIIKHKGKITVIGGEANKFLLESENFSVKPGQILKAKYKIDLHLGSHLKIGFLMTDRTTWYKDMHELITAKSHSGILEAIVPTGETTASLVIHTGSYRTPVFTVNKLDFVVENVPSQ